MTTTPSDPGRSSGVGTPGQRVNRVPGGLSDIINWTDGSIRFEER